MDNLPPSLICAFWILVVALAVWWTPRKLEQRRIERHLKEEPLEEEFRKVRGLVKRLNEKYTFGITAYESTVRELYEKWISGISVRFELHVLNDDIQDALRSNRTTLSAPTYMRKKNQSKPVYRPNKTQELEDRVLELEEKLEQAQQDWYMYHDPY